MKSLLGPIYDGALIRWFGDGSTVYKKTPCHDVTKIVEKRWNYGI